MTPARVEVGSRWMLWHKPRTVFAIDENHQRGYPGNPYALVIPERTPEEAAALRLVKHPTPHHWTDWIPLRSLENHGIPLPESGEVPAEVQDLVDADAAARKARSTDAVVAKARKQAVITPEKRLKNRITSARHKLNHPEKHGRTEWTPLEVAEIEATMRDAEEQLQKEAA
jgi:hypothetical protein